MTPSEAVALVETLKPLVQTDEADVVFCVPAIDLIPVIEAVKGTNIEVARRICTMKKRAPLPERSLPTC